MCERKYDEKDPPDCDSNASDPKDGLVGTRNMEDTGIEDHGADFE